MKGRKAIPIAVQDILLDSADHKELRRKILNKEFIITDVIFNYLEESIQLRIETPESFKTKGKK